MRWIAFLLIALVAIVGIVIAVRSHERAPVQSATTPPAAKPNLLLVTIDTLRPDHLGAYGYQGIQTATLDRLAQEGVLFRNAVCQTPLTLVSHTSMFTGLNPNVHGVRDNGYFSLSDSFMTLAEYLKGAGYTTAAFIGTAILDRSHGLAQGFDWYSQYRPTIVIGTESQRRAEEVIAEALDWLQKSQGKDKPFFVWIHLYDPHAPYNAPEPFHSQYSAAPYDGEIAYTDHVLGAFFSQLEQLGFMQNSLVVVMGDHGESLDEHREPDHGFFVYDATVKIPMIVSWRGHFSHAVVQQQVQEIDLLPTLADLMGFKTSGLIQGRDMKPLLEGKTFEPPPAYVESMTPKLYYGWSELKAIRSQDWKYIEAPDPELYNLKDDPAEKHNLISQYPDRVRQMHERLGKLAAMSPPSGSQTAGSIDAEKLQELASLGYIGATNPGAMLGASSHIDPKSKIDDYLLLHKMVPEAIAFMDQGQFQTALGQLQKVESKFSDSFVVYWYLGLCYAKLDRLAEARKAYAHAIELNPYFGRAYTDLALTLALQGHPQEATKLLDQIPAGAVSRTDQDYTRGEIEMHQQNFQAAESAYDASLRSDPQNTDTQYALARLYLATGRIREAVAKMQQLALLHYPSEDVYYGLSAIYQKQGNPQEADKAFQQWLLVFPKSAAASYRYGVFLAEKGDRKQAVTYLEKAVRLDPSMQEAAQALASIKSAS
jgi:arylsulfatase A-like enzyme/Flp pilus assembly protein TadD